MIQYTFEYEDGNTIAFEVDPTGNTGIEAPETEVPGWAELGRYRCDHCGIPPDSRRSCPAVLAIAEVVRAFEGRVSFDAVRVRVQRDKVRLTTATTTQDAVRSLIGLQLALSGCPTMSKLRPMARHHVPFADVDQTVFRVVGMYLVAQYLGRLQGRTPDWDLAGLQLLYGEIRAVNLRLADRIRAASERDATINSLIILDAFAGTVEISIEECLEEMIPDFKAYLDA